MFHHGARDVSSRTVRIFNITSCSLRFVDREASNYRGSSSTICNDIVARRTRAFEAQAKVASTVAHQRSSIAVQQSPSGGILFVALGLS